MFLHAGYATDDSSLIPSTSAPPEESQATLAKNSQLYLSDMRLQLSRSYSGKTLPDGRGEEILKLVAHIQPRVLHLNESGDLEVIPAPKTKLRAQILLLGAAFENGQRVLRKLAESPWSTPAWHQPSLLFPIAFEIPQPFYNPEGQALVGLRLVPLDQPDLLPFEGVFSLGEWQKLSNVVFATEDPSFYPWALESEPKDALAARGQFQISSIVDPRARPANPHFSTPANLTEAENLQRTGIRTLRLEFRTQKMHNQDFWRETEFGVQACFVREIDRKPLVGQFFRVTRFNGKPVEEPLASTNEGCIYWTDDSIRWDYFGPECFFEGKVRIRSENLGFDAEIPVDINPYYNSHNGEVWARDRRFLYSDSPETGCPPGSSHLIARNPNLSTRLYQHAIDPMLNLGLIKKLQANLSLSLRRPSFRGPVGGYREVEIPYGKYRLRYAAVNQFFFLNEKTFSTAAANDPEAVRSRFLTDQRAFMYREKVIEHLGFSSIQEEFEIFMWNLREMGNNNILLFEVTPLQNKKRPNARLDSRVFQTPFIMSREDSIGNIIPVSEEFQRAANPSILDQIERMYKADVQFFQDSQKKIFGKETYARDNFLELINLTNPVTLPFSVKTLFLGGTLPKKEIHALCDFWFRTLLTKSGGGLSTGVIQDSGFSAWGAISGQFKDVADLVDDCKQSSAKNLSSYFQIENHYFLKDPLPPTYRESVTNRFTLSAGIQLNRAFGFSRSESTGWDLGVSFRLENFRFWKGKPSKSGFEMPQNGEMAQPPKTVGGQVRTMVTNPNYWILNPQPLSTGLKWIVNRQFSDSQGVTNSVYSANLTSFKVERLHFTVQGRDFEKCISVRLTPLASLGNDLLLANINRDSFGVALALAMSRGLFICQGKWVGRPSPALSESYYVINQDDATHLTATDPFTNLNRPYFIKIRGQSDFLAFLSLVHDQIRVPEYERQDSALKKFWMTETRVLELAKQLSPFYFKRLTLGVSPQEKDFHVAQFSDESDSGYLFKIKNLFMKDFSLRGLRSYPGHVVVPRE